MLASRKKGAEKKKTEATKPEKPVKTLVDFTNSKYDLVGPADKLSNIRQYRYYVPEDETKLEFDYRMMRHRVHAFNDTYWTQQNLKFIEARKNFIETFKRRKRQMRGSSGASKEENDSLEPTLAEMNDFYRQFLNENYYNHYEYNQKWIRLNFGLLVPAFRVHMYRLRKRIMQRK